MTWVLLLWITHYGCAWGFPNHAILLPTETICRETLHPVSRDAALFQAEDYIGVYGECHVPEEAVEQPFLSACALVP